MSASPSNGTYTRSTICDRFSYFYEINKTTTEVKKIKPLNILPEKKEIYMFDIKDLVLKEG